MYHITSKEDLEFLKDAENIWGWNTDFDKYGPGWYIYYCEDGGDYMDSYYLYNYIEYEKRMEDELRKWKAGIREKAKIETE